MTLYERKNKWRSGMQDSVNQLVRVGNERIPNLIGEQSDGITVFRIPPMTSLMLHRCRTVNLDNLPMSAGNKEESRATAL
ncbi:hypothetical protein ANN_21183 [Periplaneta americana]|uniref:Uncharacterized protein n=1 Tax=Periplaneta americana TaxID=6978 RepID=A0ABQ8SFG4_PERAM|nr:hypothetical protein ANN_21183 [Periplaneta americana]